MITFTIDDVRAAYRATGLKPKLGGWMSDNYTRACPLTAMCAKRQGKAEVLQAYQAVEDTGRADKKMEQLASAALGITTDEARAFWNGVDEAWYRDNPNDSGWDLPEEREAYNAGFEIGQGLHNEIDPVTDELEGA